MGAACVHTLGIEYCRALLRTGSEAEVFTVPRHGAAHDAAVSEAGGCSASAIRTLLAEGTEADALSRMVPAMRRVYEEEKAAGRAPVFAADCERAITGMQIYMDGDALVGSVATRMDYALGGIYASKDRRTI